MAVETKKAALTRSQAEVLIARATTAAALEDEKLTKHVNKHVLAKLKHKLGKLSA